LICTGYFINSESMACYCQQARKRGDFKNVFMPGPASVSEHQVFCAYNH
jgi:hypothetical protein